MNTLRVAFCLVTLYALAAGTGVSADDVSEQCKNHYILDDPACSDSPAPTVSPAPVVASYRVGIGDDCDVGLSCFTPSSLTIAVGDSVEFYQYADTLFTGAHNVVADDGSFRCAIGCDGEGGDGTPVSDSICNGSSCVFNPIRLSFVRTFNAPGIVRYHDEVSGAVGAIVVQGPALAPGAAAPTFQITQVFSNLDGTIQFVQLTETAGLDDQQHFAGLTLTATHNGVAKRFTFPADLPTSHTAHLSVVVAAVQDPIHSPVIVEITNCCRVNHPVDYVLPARFLPTDGGTIDFAGVDQVSYASLPTDGKTALYRDGKMAPAVLARTQCQFSPISCPNDGRVSPTPVSAIEYYDAIHDRYFLTAAAPDIEALDSGSIPGWQRTGEWFGVGGSAVSWLWGVEYQYVGVPVCRFSIPPDSHFLSASADECAWVSAQLGFVQETNAAFFAGLPDPVSGECPPLAGIIDGDLPQRPLYRLWDQRADANHRYTTNPDIRAAMIAQGWVSEGYGPMGVAMCVL